MGAQNIYSAEIKDVKILQLFHISQCGVLELIELDPFNCYITIAINPFI
jgi:hypothetical protein